MTRRFRFGIFPFLSFFLIVSFSFAQTEKEVILSCGAAEVNLPNPDYVQTNQGMVVVEVPEGWFLDKEHKNPFYFIPNGETFKSARTLMYVHSEALEASLEEAIEADIAAFKKGCVKLNVENLQRASLLEQGCARRTQMFTCIKTQYQYIDLVTKIDFNGSLLNVVLSADTSEEIKHYRKDYDFLLQHLTMIKSKI